jgi:hypothetical protein
VDSPNNLWEPQDGPDGHDVGADGRFGDQQWTRDPQIRAGRQHGVLAAVGAAGIAGPAVVRRRR